MGNFDSQLFLGGNEPSTTESEYALKRVDTRTSKHGLHQRPPPHVDARETLGKDSDGGSAKPTLQL